MVKNVKHTFKSVKAIWSFSFENFLFIIGITLLLAIEFFEFILFWILALYLVCSW